MPPTPHPWPGLTSGIEGTVYCFTLFGTFTEKKLFSNSCDTFNGNLDNILKWSHKHLDSFISCKRGQVAVSATDGKWAIAILILTLSEKTWISLLNMTGRSVLIEKNSSLYATVSNYVTQSSFKVQSVLLWCKWRAYSAILSNVLYCS